MVGSIPQVIFFWSFDTTIAVQPEGMQRYVSATQISLRKFPGPGVEDRVLLAR